MFAQLAAGRDVAFRQSFLHAFPSISKHLDALHALLDPPPGNTFLILRCHVSEVKAILLLIRVGMFLLGWSGWKVEDYGGLGGEEVRRQTLTTRLRRCYTNVNIGFLLQSCENPIIKYLPETGMFLSPVCFLSVSGINKGGCREPAACQARTWKPLGPRSLNALAHLS